MRKLSALTLGLLVLSALVGCGSGSTSSSPSPSPGPPPTPTPVAPTKFSGKVMAGSQPVIGAAVQMYAAGTAGNGSTPTLLSTTAITTDSTGTFAVPGDYTCPSDSSVVYIVSRGGHAGTAGATNAGTVLADVLGTCGSLSGSSTFVVNEATTVGMVYAMAQFMKAGSFVGAGATNSSGIRLAAGTAANLVNTATGAVPGAAFPATGTAPTARINSLANLLNACIGSAGASSAACTQLYALTSVAGVAPSNTLDAALSLVQHPGASVVALYTQSAASTAFAPALAAAPTDWTLFVTYSGGGLNAPAALAIDGAGNVWVSNYFFVASLFSNTGAPAFPSGITGNNLNNSYGVAVDANNNAWITNQQSSPGINGGVGSITVLNTAGQSVAGGGYAAGGLNFPISVAIDTAATSWIVDYGNSHLTLLSSSGTPLSGPTGYTTDQFVFPVAVAVDSKRSGYLANQSSNTVTKAAADGSRFTSYVVGSGPSSVAVDGADNVWTGNYYGNTVALLSSTGTLLSGGGFTGGGIRQPQGVAIDGAGSAWIANYRGPSITQLAGASAAIPGTALSPAAGWGPDAQLLEAFGIAIDASGNVWVSNFGSNTITQFVGMAVPVRTPLVGPVAVP